MPADHGLYYLDDCPLLAGHCRRTEHGAAPAGQPVLPLPATHDLQPGEAVVVRHGGSRLPVCRGTDPGWVTPNPAVQLSNDGAFLRADVASAYGGGQEILSFVLPAAADWSAYDQLNVDARCAEVSNFFGFPPGGLVLVVRDAAGRVVSRVGADGNFGNSSGPLRLSFPLDQVNPLTSVGSFSLVADVVKARDHTHSLAWCDQGGLVPATGSAFALWLDNVSLSADLHTTVADTTSTSAALADPLGAALPETSLSIVNPWGRGLYHDDGPALAAFLASVPDFAEVAVPSGLRLPIGSTINLSGRQGLRIAGRSGAGSSYPNASYALPSFTWLGRAGGNFFLFDRSRGHVLEGLTWRCDGPLPPRSAVNCDMLPGTGSGITSDLIFSRCQVQGPASYPPFSGFEVSRVSRQNCEFIRYRDCIVAASKVFPGQGVGFYLGGSFNAKTIEFDYCSTGNCAAGWRSDGGSFHARYWTADFNSVDFLIYNSAEPITVEGGNSEYAGGAFFVNSNYSVRFGHNRWSSLRSGSGAPDAQAGAFRFGTAGGGYVLEGNKVATHALVQNPVLLDPASVSYLIDSRCNRYETFDCLLSNFNRAGGGKCLVKTSLDSWGRNGTGA